MMPGPIRCVNEIGECILWLPLKRHFDYWWCFDNNIQGLRAGIRDLDKETFDMNQRIELARVRAEVLRPGVKDWSNAGAKMVVEARRSLPDDNIPKAWNLISRYLVGKGAKQKAEEIAQLRNDGNFDTISDLPPPATMGSTHRPIVDFESRKRNEDEIIRSLSNSNVSIIGICGMGGVGKTTMVERIRERVMEEKLFDEVVMVVVSQQIDMLKIQKEIAEFLGLKFGDVYTLFARANILHIRLMDTKRKIIIFDDVWESLKLEDLGVPFGSGFDRCKIILTTRSKDICIRMEAQLVIALEVLTKEEAWCLFKEKAGHCVEDSNLLSVAKAIAAECKGLPIALVTVGKLLQNQRKSIWEDSLSQLRRSNPTDFSEVLADVYRPLKLSYDYLDNDTERFFFLLCCLFPEDYNIPVEHLMFYSKGLGMFDRIRTIEEARNRTHSLVEKLIRRSLLIYCGKEDLTMHLLHVKMHDLVRDVAIYIGSKERRGFLKSLKETSMDSSRENSSPNCEWMSMSISNEIIELPLGFRFPNLHLLMMLKSTSDKASDISFEGMEDLNVLSFSEIDFPSPPRTLGLLKNLRTLHLYGSTVENISVVGELASLEILSFCYCKDIVELPAKIGRLNRLRYLELYECYQLKTIAFGVISSLVRLEELKMIRSYCNWEAGEKGWEAEEKRIVRRNAALIELQSLTNLTSLEIEIHDCNLAALEICLSQKLVKYCINFVNYVPYFGVEKVMSLNLPRHINVGKWIHILVRNTECLELEGDGSNNLNLGESENLRILQFGLCSTVKKLVNTMDCKFGIVFRSLESLRLFKLEKLEEICYDTIPEGSSNSFQNLRKLSVEYLPELAHLWKSPNQNVSLCNLTSIFISKCFNLLYLFSVSIARSLLQLEVLEIKFCQKMEQVFWNEIKSITSASIEFPKLKKLKLRDLPKLIAFCQGVESIQFPNLSEMEIGDLPKLNSLSPLSSDDDTSFHFLCNQKVEIGSLKILSLYYLKDNISNIWCHHIPINFFSNLEELRIFHVNGIRNLLSSSIVINLVSLKYLSIKSCQEMVEVIEVEKEVVDLSLFLTLKVLEIQNLLKLRSFCLWKYALELPSLEEVKIYDCPRMKTFTLGSLSTPNIKKLTIDKINIGDAKDLNGVIHNFTTKS